MDPNRFVISLLFEKVTSEPMAHFLLSPTPSPKVNTAGIFIFVSFTGMSFSSLTNSTPFMLYKIVATFLVFSDVKVAVGW